MPVPNREVAGARGLVDRGQGVALSSVA